MRYPLLMILVAAALAVSAFAQPGPRFATGGIGEEERAAMQAVRGQYNLQLTFAVKGAGNFLAGVDVVVSGVKGAPVLRATSEGPLFFALLAPGSYTVSATYGGETQARRVSVRARGRTEIFFYWVES